MKSGEVLSVTRIYCDGIDSDQVWFKIWITPAHPTRFWLLRQSVEDKRLYAVIERDVWPGPGWLMLSILDQYGTALHVEGRNLR